MKPNFLLGGVAGLAILAACQTAPSDDMSDSLEAAETIEVEQVMDAEESVEVEAAVEAEMEPKDAQWEVEAFGEWFTQTMDDHYVNMQ